MKFQPKNSGGGRKKGSVNIATKNIRNAVECIVNDNLEKLKDDINELSPKDRINALTNLIGYVLPKLKSIDTTFDVVKGNEITQEDIKLIRQEFFNKY